VECFRGWSGCLELPGVAPPLWDAPAGLRRLVEDVLGRMIQRGGYEVGMLVRSIGLLFA
jgi:hypothetical protein